MARRIYDYGLPDRFVAGTVGQPGNRTFFLQARRGSALVSVALEKVQVQVLAERMALLLAEVARRGVRVPEALAARRRRHRARSTSRSSRRSASGR